MLLDTCLRRQEIASYKFIAGPEKWLDSIEHHRRDSSREGVNSRGRELNPGDL